MTFPFPLPRVLRLCHQLPHADTPARPNADTPNARTPVRVAFAAFTAFSLAVQFAQAATSEDPLTMLRKGTDEVLAIAYSGQSPESLPDRLRPLLQKDFAFELVTRQAIGPGWRQFTPSERQQVTDLFTRLLLRIYSARVVGTQRPNINYGKPVTLAPDRCEISTQVTIPNTDKPYSVVYRVIKLPEGWRVYDVLIEGVSFVANYRAQFDEVVQRGGAPAVIQALKAKLAQPINPNS
jgi:phospholipid transport system substrate-binding protein